MNKVLNNLGIAYRASKVLLGEKLLAQMALVKLVFVASDASAKTQERLAKKCYYYKLPCIKTYSSQEISAAIGKNNVMILGITDTGLATSILKEIERRSVNGETSA